MRGSYDLSRYLRGHGPRAAPCHPSAVGDGFGTARQRCRPQPEMSAALCGVAVRNGWPGRGSWNGADLVDGAARLYGRTGKHLVAGQCGVDRRAGAIDAPQDAERPEQAILVGGGSRQP